MQPTDQLAHILPTVSGVVARISPSELDNPTPCDRFAVRDVLDHLMVGAGTFAYLFRGEAPPEITSPPADGSVPTTEFRQAMDDLFAAVRSPGAMERTVPAPIGELPGESVASFLAFDVLMHGWDLARATDQAYAVDAEIVAAADETAHDMLTAELRDGDTFANPTTPPEHADQLERVVAFSGRQV